MVVALLNDRGAHHGTLKVLCLANRPLYGAAVTMRVMTWNVLHRVHAENYSEPTVALWPDEAARVQAVVQQVCAAVSEQGCELVLLQEASGEVVVALRRCLPGSMSVHTHQVARMPQLKVKSTTSLSDASEHVVVIAPGGSQPLRRQTALDDAGKGLLAVQVSEGLVAISTHVSWGQKGVGQMRALQELMKTLPGVVIVGGDFNTERGEVTAHLGPDLLVTQLTADSPRTRQNPDGQGSDIDHLVCRGAKWSDVHVVVHPGLSDHHPLFATLQLGEGEGEG